MDVGPVVYQDIAVKVVRRYHLLVVTEDVLTKNQVAAMSPQLTELGMYIKQITKLVLIQ